MFMKPDIITQAIEIWSMWYHNMPSKKILTEVRVIIIRLKNNSMSQGSRRIGKPDSRCFFPQQKNHVWVCYNLCSVWNMELYFRMNIIQNWNRSVHRFQEVCWPICFIMSVISFYVFFDRQVRTNWEQSS